MDKDKVAEILVEIGTLLELKGENPFKTRAYANGARTIEGLSEPLTKLVAEKRLGEIKGIGAALEQKISELVETGKLKYYDELKASIAPGLIEMLEISGLGPKKIQAMHKQLGIDSLKNNEITSSKIDINNSFNFVFESDNFNSSKSIFNFSRKCVHNLFTTT